MKQVFIAALIAGTLSAPMVFAESEDAVTDSAIVSKISSTMEAQGYEVRKIVREHGKYEVYAVKDGSMFEVYLNDAYEITRIKAK